MKLKLNIPERFALLSILPEKENYLTFRLLMDLKKELGFTEQEIKKSGMETKGNQVVWTNGNIIKTIEIPDTIEAILVEKLKEIEKNKEINENNVTLYEKIILNKDGRNQ